MAVSELVQRIDDSRRAFLEVIESLDDSQLLRSTDVLLVWQKPLDYDWVVIARNNVRIARIPGDQFFYIDRNVPPGVYIYQVFGILNGRISPPATNASRARSP